MRRAAHLESPARGGEIAAGTDRAPAGAVLRAAAGNANYAPNQSQCHARLPFADLGNSRWRLKDLLGDATYDWDGNDLQGGGLYLDERPWSVRVFALTRG
jgi:hypothetical protein